VANAFSSATFSDVATGHWAWGEVEECARAHSASSDFVTEGFGDGNYWPGLVVNRAAMAVFVARGAGYTDTAPTTPTFSDIATDFWSYNEIERCVANNVVGGYPDGTYRPNVTVTRDQMAVYIQRAVGFATAPAAGTFSDVGASHWAVTEIEACVANNVVQGYPDGTYKPGNDVTRGQMAVFVWRGLVGDVVLNDPAGTTVAAIAPAEGSAQLYLPGATTMTGAASAALAPGVTVYVVLDAVRVTTGNIVFDIEDSGAVYSDSETLAVLAGDYDDEVNANTGYPYLIASYTIESGLGSETYSVEITLPNGAVLDAGSFTVP
jgi:hypothetical protein